MKLANPHPGDILREDFLVNRDVTVRAVAVGGEIDEDTLAEVLAGLRAIDANLDARLTRYFGVSDEFFLRLQRSFDAEEQ